MKEEIIYCLTRYASMVAEPLTYTNWSDKFCMGELRSSNSRFINELKKYIDFDNLTKEEALELGFKQWRDDQPDLYLIPLYLFPLIPIGKELHSINGDTITYNGTNVDTDNRFGLLAYGILIKN